MGERIGLGSVSAEARLEQIEALKLEHAALKRRIGDYQSRRFLSPAEQLERKRLQKMKLLAKDRIARLSSELEISP